METASTPMVIGAVGATLERARLRLHRVGMPIVAAFLTLLFTASLHEGLPNLPAVLTAIVVALVALTAAVAAVRATRVSGTLERALLLGTLAVLAAGSLEAALAMRFLVAYPYILTFLSIGYAAAFVFLGPRVGSIASLATYAVTGAATLVAFSTGELIAVRTLPILVGSPILIGLLHTLSWSLKLTAAAHIAAKEAAETDPLTGALNRRSGEAVLEDLEGPFALLVLDLDGFKRLNDEYGHAFGDDVLVRVAHALRNSVRPADIVVRWGGDEFVVIAPSDSDTAAQLVAERVRVTIAALRDRAGGMIYASIGLAMHQRATPWRATFERADAAMYSAKRAVATPGTGVRSSA